MIVIELSCVLVIYCIADMIVYRCMMRVQKTLIELKKNERVITIYFLYIQLYTTNRMSIFYVIMDYKNSSELQL